MIWNVNTLALLIPMLFLLIGLSITVAIDPYISREHRRVMGIIIALSVTLIIQNVWEDYIAAGPPRWFLRTTLAVYGYTIRPVFLILFLYIVQPGTKHLACWALAILNWAVNMTAFFSHLCFYIDEANHYQGGPLHTVTYVVGTILLGIWLFQSVREYPTSRKRNLIIPLFVVLIISVSVLLDRQAGTLNQPISFLTFSIVICSMLYYIWLHLRFVREHEDDLKAQQRIQIMLSQIQPHFLYNTLGAIEGLCDSDPKAAKEAAHKFSRYLQGNMTSITEAGEIPFERELEHTKNYLELEQTRYGSSLRICYDITCTDFKLPTLTLQPIVENAVRHGARGKKKGEGTVTIATREYPDHYEIDVMDDGPGFDLTAPVLADDGRAHIGIQNVRDRLRSVSGGELRIESERGRGTTATIILPKKTEEA